MSWVSTRRLQYFYTKLKEKIYLKTEVDTKLSDKANASHTHTKANVGLGNVTNDAQVKRSEMGAANGVATLGADGKVPSSQLPSYVDDVLEYKGTANFPSTGESGKIYVDKTTNKTYRWSGSSYIEISASIVVGTTTGTAFDGKIGNDHINNKSNPHSITKAQIGLSNVENKSSATIRSELTKANVTDALGYTPPTTNTTYGVATSSTLGLIKSGTDIIVDSNGNVSVNDDSHNHTIANVDGLQTALDGKAASSHTHDDRYYTEDEMNTKLNAKLNTSLKGEANGLAELDSNGRVPSAQLPSYVDDVIEGYLYNSKFYKESAHTTEITGETGKIYVDLLNNKTYRWSGSTYVVISETLALGETSSTAYRGDRGKTAYDHSQSTHARTDATKVEASSTNGNIKINGSDVTVYTHPSGTNPHGTTKSDLGLGNVGNFKAVSTVASQGLTDTEKSNARANIGAGTSNLTIGTGAGNAAAGNHTHSYNDLSNKPSIPSALSPYPVGSVYFSVNNTNPSTYFGGTWVQIGSKLAVRENVFGNGKSLAITQGSSIYSLGTSQDEIYGYKLTPSSPSYANVGGGVNRANIRGTAFGVISKAQAGSTPANSGLIVDTETIYSWKRTA